MATPTTLPSSFTAGQVLTAAQMNDLRGAFRILQVVSTTKTDTYSTTSTTYVDVTGLTVSITPSAATNKILLIGNLALSNQSDEAQGRLAVGGSAIAVGDASGSITQATWGLPATDGSPHANISVFAAFPMSMTHLDSPATTSALTYSIQVRRAPIGAAQTVYVNRAFTESNSGEYARTVSSLTAIEVSA